MRVLQERKGEESEEWREDARCVWRVLRGEEGREIFFLFVYPKLDAIAQLIPPFPRLRFRA